MMATQSNTAHPLPAAPDGGAQGVHYAPQHKPTISQASNNVGGTRKSRTFSLKSDKSQRSSGGISFKFGPETHDEKQAKRLHTKADPTLAMNEAEPAALAANEKTQLAPLRSIAHRDIYGNPIVNPDKSNPTRDRMERPLDTIRSFEAAIEGAYSRKSSYGGDGESMANFGGSRRNSRPNLANARFPQNSYYAGSRDSRFGSGGYDGQPFYNDSGRQRYSRMGSESQIYGNNAYGGGAGVGSSRMGGEQNVYPMPNNHRSYETVASGSGSGILGEPAGYQTDPTSSDNSSIERNGSPSKRFQQVPGDDQAYPAYNNGGAYNGNGPNGTGRTPIQLSASSATAPPSANSPYWQQKQQEMQAAAASAPPAAQKGSILRKGTKSGDDKRKSWFSRRFSKQQD